MPAGTKENYVELQLDRDRVKHLAWLHAEIPTSSDHAEAIANATMTTTRVQPPAAAAFAIPPLLPNIQQPPPSVATSLLGAPAIYHQPQHQLSTLGQPGGGSEWARYIPQQALPYGIPFHSNGGGSFVHVPPPVAPPAPVIIIPIFQPQQQPTWGGASLPSSAGDTTPSPERPSSTRKMRKMTLGRVLAEDDEEEALSSSSPDMEWPEATRRKPECKDEDQDKKEAAVGPKDVTASRTRARRRLHLRPRRRTLAIKYLRHEQGFFPSQATLDPDTPVNWVSGDLVRGFFPAGQFKRRRSGRREYYESPGEDDDGRYRFESDESIVITWRCVSGKLFDSEFRVLRGGGGGSSIRPRRAPPPGFIFGQAAMEEHWGEFGLGDCHPLFGDGGGGREEAKRCSVKNKPPTTPRTLAASASVYRVSKLGMQRQQRRQEGVGVHPGRSAGFVVRE